MIKNYSECGAWVWCGMDYGCQCNRENCHYCKKICHTHTKKCGFIKYPNKYVCWGCRKGWGHNGGYGMKSHCPTCGKVGEQVSHVVHIPKNKDKKGWDLLRKIILSEELKDSKKGTLGWLWFRYGGIGMTLHWDKESANQFWIPKKLHEYDQWIHYMLNTLYKKN
jgi:hypothetical protein